MDRVNRYYDFNYHFYMKKPMSLTSDTWSKLKLGRAKLETTKAERVYLIIDNLFTSYEQLIISELLKSKIDKHGACPVSLFSEKKKEKLEKWLELYPENVEVFTDWFMTNENTPTAPFIEVVLDNGVDRFIMRFKTKEGNIPNFRDIDGKSWLTEHFKSLV